MPPATLSGFGRSLRRLSRNPGAMAGACVLTALLLVAAAGSVLAPYDPTATGVGVALGAPDRDHLFGTDRYGRDLLSRIMVGARLSLPIGLLAVSFAALFGTLLGLATGYFGGRVDSLGSKLIDIMLGFPPIMLALLIIAVLGIGMVNVVVAVGIGGIPRFARIVRGATISARENVYVEAARAVGMSAWRLLFRHILPNVAAPIIVLATLYTGRAILESSALGFLGMGVQPPTPEWGSMLSEGREFMRHAWWLMVFPGVSLFLTVVSINLLGDFLREVLDPRLRGT
ncbi:MAG: ABC transporter permease [Armatimonadota bacterium]|nr:ABC transporter permease [Armatimonadota bacterium]